MENIEKIYDNPLGISFFWRNVEKSEKVQLIFRDTGFYLSKIEIEEFLRNATTAKKYKCGGCSSSRHCKSILLKTPTEKVSLTVCLDELDNIEDLLAGTIFQMNLRYYLDKICKN